MLEGYHKLNNNHALNVLNRRVDIPEARLGIGFAENMGPYHLKVIYQTHRNKVVVPELDDIAIEFATVDGQGAIYTETDFPRNHYIGSPLS